MKPLLEIDPLPRVSGDHAAGRVHAHLRRLILEAVIPPGTVVTQVELAARLGVSRTPIREAIRMLQEEGLVVAEPQKRARVVGFDPADVEAIYTQRILLESLAAGMTAETATAADVERLDILLDQMHGSHEQQDLASWERVHREFHLAIVAGAGERLLGIISGFIDRTELYRRAFWEDAPRAWSVGAGEHQAIVEAFRRRDRRAAASEVASHLARTGLTLIINFSPQVNAVALRGAVALVSPEMEHRAAIPRQFQGRTGSG